MTLRASISDYLRERRIKALARAIREAVSSGEPFAGHGYEAWFKAEVEARTPGAIERMERGRGLR